MKINALDLKKISFNDQDISKVKLNESQIIIELSGARIDSGERFTECKLVFQNVYAYQACVWDMRDWMRDDADILNLREICEHEVNSESITLKGFTRNSRWIEVAIQCKTVDLECSDL